jgi:nucleoside-triphosphatase THEP1
MEEVIFGILNGDNPSTFVAPFSISIHGEPGTGKSILAAKLTHQLLRANRLCAAIVLGAQGNAGQLLNQMLALHLPPFVYIFEKQLVVTQAVQVDRQQLLKWVEDNVSREKVILVDNIDKVESDVKGLEEVVHSLATKAGAISIVVSSYPPSCPIDANIRIELTRQSIEIERGRWDAVLRFRWRDADKDFLLKISDSSLLIEPKGT